jgi:toxin ParE1/3/4
MAVVARTLQAEADLIQIWLYIAGDNPEAADALLDRIDQQFELLAATPYMGQG